MLDLNTVTLTKPLLMALPLKGDYQSLCTEYLCRARYVPAHGLLRPQ